MPSLPIWAKGRRDYLEAMQDRDNPKNSQYAFELLRYMYASVYRLETVLTDPIDINPDDVETCISVLEDKVQELREWQRMKIRESRGLSATT
ncbi:MAG TPA: hypothetical protein VGF75_06885 [Candidatus Saccharimonadales bacterium]|jgi:hypothetical protein